MDFAFTPEQERIREAIARLCERFGDDYWLKKDREGGFPADFHQAFARDGWLGIAMPEAYGGSGLGIAEAAVMMQAIAESGAGGQHHDRGSHEPGALLDLLGHLHFLRLGHDHLLHGAVLHDDAEHRKQRDSRIVRDEDDRDAARAVQFAEQGHDLFARLGVEIARRFVRQQD